MKNSAPQIAAPKRTIINLTPRLAPQMGAPDKAAPCVLAAEIGLFLDIKVPISIGSCPHCETQILAAQSASRASTRLIAPPSLMHAGRARRGIARLTDFAE
jgi:hypothetical protein